MVETKSHVLLARVVLRSGKGQWLTSGNWQLAILTSRKVQLNCDGVQTQIQGLLVASTILDSGTKSSMGINNNCYM